MLKKSLHIYSCVAIVFIVSLLVYLYNINVSGEDLVVKEDDVSIQYFIEECEDYDSVFISPIAVQSAIQRTYDKSVSEQGKDFTTIWGSSLRNSSELLSRIKRFNSSVVDISVEDADYTENTVFSIFVYDPVLLGASYNSDTYMIQIDSGIKYKEADSYVAVRLNCTDDDHYIYLVDGDLSEFNTYNFKSTNKTVEIAPYIWQTIGSVPNLVSRYTEDILDVKVINQFGFDIDNYEENNTDNQYDLSFIDNYYVVVTNKNNKIVGVGRR